MATNRHGIRIIGRSVHNNGKKDPSHEKGKQRELKFFLAFQEIDFFAPAYFATVRWATPQEEKEGPDFFISMTEGIEMPVNIKSSKTLLKKFRTKKNRRENLRLVIAFVVNEDDTNEQIRERLFADADEWRKQFLTELLQLKTPV